MKNKIMSEIKTFEELVQKAKKLFPNLQKHDDGSGDNLTRYKGFTIEIDIEAKNLKAYGLGHGRSYIEFDFFQSKGNFFINIDTNSYNHMEDILFNPIKDIMILYRFIKVLKELNYNKK